jgi:hypothetical protein
MDKAAKDSTDPIERFLSREEAFMTSLIQRLRKDLTAVRSTLLGTSRQTNHTREITATLVKGLVPVPWARYKSRSSIGLQDWVQDLKLRIDHINALNVEGIQHGVWLGGLAFPHGLATAFRQKAAQEQGVSIESLSLEISLDGEAKTGFLIKGARKPSCLETI